MTVLTEFVELDRRGRVAVITVNNPPNNVLSHGVRKGLKDGVIVASGAAAISAMSHVCGPDIHCPRDTLSLSGRRRSPGSTRSST